MQLDNDPVSDVIALTSGSYMQQSCAVIANVRYRLCL